MIKTKADYPIILTALEVAEILQTSKCNAYRVMDFKGFPLVRVGRLKRVGRDAFFEWFEKQGSNTFE
ncbi:DNA-binding protein (plasmid) [Pseudalkalibacillus hwajinpoensis]|uniref:DNA-binding protein n=1 Tax=Guptibacillus hwajinpoensis TaxID=208199 RepID=UPI00325AED82